jgi:hypothetical protein
MDERSTAMKKTRIATGIPGTNLLATQTKELQAPRKNPGAVPVCVYPGDDPAAAVAQTLLRPTVQAASTVRAYNKRKDGSGPEIQALIAELGKQVELVGDGNLTRAEGMLIAQAHSLDAIFGSLARRAAAQEYLPQFEAHLRLAFKAQSQCRATLETLALIKNPAPVAFVRQQNVAVNQQVNNRPPEGVARAEELPIQSNELLEAQRDRLDTGATEEAIGSHSHLEALGPVNRSKDERG